MFRAGFIVALLLSASATHAECFADYKAKRDDPLRLHYGVVELSDQTCRSPGAVETEIRDRLAKNEWTLLNVVGTFDESGLEERRQSAGEHFLRY